MCRDVLVVQNEERPFRSQVGRKVCQGVAQRRARLMQDGDGSEAGSGQATQAAASDRSRSECLRLGECLPYRFACFRVRHAPTSIKKRIHRCTAKCSRCRLVISCLRLMNFCFKSALGKVFENVQRRSPAFFWVVKNIFTACLDTS